MGIWLQKIILNGTLVGNIFKTTSDNLSNDWIFKLFFVEDEYKSYLQKSMKRKLRSSNVFETNELHKDQQRWSALFHESIAHEISTEKLKIAPTNLKSGFLMIRIW